MQIKLRSRSLTNSTQLCQKMSSLFAKLTSCVIIITATSN